MRRFSLSLSGLLRCPSIDALRQQLTLIEERPRSDVAISPLRRACLRGASARLPRCAPAPRVAPRQARPGLRMKSLCSAVATSDKGREGAENLGARLKPER